MTRNKAAWSVAKVDADGAFSIDLDLPAAWVVGSSHQVMIGDGATGNYVQVEVKVVESSVRSAFLLTGSDSVGDRRRP